MNANKLIDEEKEVGEESAGEESVIPSDEEDADASEVEEEDAEDASEAEDAEDDASDAGEEESGAEDEDLKPPESPSASEAESSEAESSEPEPESSEAEAEASEAEAEASDDETGVEGAKPLVKKSKGKRTNKKNITGVEMLKTTKNPDINIDSDDEDEEDDEFYLQKFDKGLRENFILNHHPEAKTHNYEEVKALSRVTRDGRGIIVDPYHKTLPFLTKYERTRIIGQRAKQIDSGAKTFVKVPLNIIDGYHIAMLELEQKKLPFIIKRPFPNGGIEYWNVSDLEIL